MELFIYYWEPWIFMKELWPVGFLKWISHTVQPLAVYISCSQNLCLTEHKSRMCYSVSYTCTFIFSWTYSFIFTTIYFTCSPALLSRTNDTCTSDSLMNASSQWFLNWWVVKLPEELGKITKTVDPSYFRKTQDTVISYVNVLALSHSLQTTYCALLTLLRLEMVREAKIPTCWDDARQRMQVPWRSVGLLFTFWGFIRRRITGFQTAVDLR